jgi:hypothetical protein
MTQPIGESNEELSVRKNIFYEQRQQRIYQFASQHYFPKTRIKIDANASYTDGSSVVPDFKLTEYVAFSAFNQLTGSYQFSPNAGDGIRRYYRYLDENLFDSRLSLEVPLAADSVKLIRKLKFGGAFQSTDRNSKMEEYFLMAGNAIPSTLQNEDLDAFLDTNQMVMQNGSLNYFYDPRNWDWNHTIGTNHISALYGMLDFEMNKRIRLNGGLRAEHVSLFSDVYKYHILGYARNDGRRVSVPGYPIINPGVLDEWSLLPSGSLIFKFKSEKNLTNLRLNYSKSVARPNIREMNDAAVYDNEFRTLIYGNSNLKMTQITNYDLRYESYFENKDNFSVSVFYKSFLNHIEMGFGSSGITWDNNENSYVAGLELELNKNIGKHLEFKSNVTLVKSQSQFVRKDFIILNNNQVQYFPVDTVVRTMFGQAPYIVNGILVYNADSLGLTATMSYNVQGPRLVIAGILKGFANVYEMPRHTVDFKVSKNIGKHYAMSLTVRDILNAPVRRAYQLNDGSYVDFDRFRYGTTFQFGFTYKIQ